MEEKKKKREEKEMKEKEEKEEKKKEEEKEKEIEKKEEEKKKKREEKQRKEKEMKEKEEKEKEEEKKKEEEEEKTKENEIEKKKKEEEIEKKKKEEEKKKKKEDKKKEGMMTTKRKEEMNLTEKLLGKVGEGKATRKKTGKEKPETFGVSEIVGKKEVGSGKKKKFLYEAMWDDGSTTWEPPASFVGCPRVMSAYEEKVDRGEGGKETVDLEEKEGKEEKTAKKGEKKNKNGVVGEKKGIGKGRGTKRKKQVTENEESSSSSVDEVGGGSEVQHAAFKLFWPMLCTLFLFARIPALIINPSFLPVMYDHTKQVTRRLWSDSHAEPYWRAFRNRWLVRVWKDYAHIHTIGWILITHMKNERVEQITQSECILEGLPNYTPAQFIQKYFMNSTIKKKRKEQGKKPITLKTECVVIRFIFYPLTIYNTA